MMQTSPKLLDEAFRARETFLANQPAMCVQHATAQVLKRMDPQTQWSSNQE